jgi:hypothetical protein
MFVGSERQRTSAQGALEAERMRLTCCQGKPCCVAQVGVRTGSRPAYESCRENCMKDTLECMRKSPKPIQVRSHAVQIVSNAYWSSRFDCGIPVRRHRNSDMETPKRKLEMIREEVSWTSTLVCRG